MKKTITRFWGVGLVIALLASLMIMTVPAAAVDNAFESVTTPGPPPYQVYVGSAVADVAVYNNGEQIWAVTGTDNYTYKSTDGGATWTRGNTSAFSDMTPDMIAIAPDDASIIAVGDLSLKKVYVTNNGGTTWSSLGTISDSTAGTSLSTMTDLALSSTFAGQNVVAVSGIDDASDGNVYTFSVGSAAPTWTQLKSKSGFPAATGFVDTIGAVEFSPNYPSDRVMLAVSANYTGAADNVSLQIYSFSHSAWNNSAGFGTGYPVNLLTATTITAITKASLALDPEYLGSDDTLQNCFVGLTLAGDSTDSGIYQVKGVTKKAIDTGQNIYSVAYDGTTLIAGTTTNTIRYSSDPMSSVPTFYPTSSLKSPGGSTNAVVAWAGVDAIAGTSGGNSAFSMSADNGKSWNDLSLVTSNTTYARDVAVSPDGSKVYWLTDDGTYVSLWRNDGGWQRILTFSDAGNKYFVRLAPEDPNVIYVAQKDGTTIYYTKDGGTVKWYQRTCGVTIKDLAIESADVAYAINSGGSVAKTSNAGFTWDPPTATSLGSGYTLTSVSEDVLLAGGTGGLVAYSMDGNKTWKKISKSVATGATNVLVVADSDFANNNIIYAASTVANLNVASYTIGTSTSWLDMMSTHFSNSQGVYGLKVQGGALYALSNNGTGTTGESEIWQCLNPAKTDYTAPGWDSVVTTSSTDSNDSGVALGNGSASNNALATSTGSNKLWMVKTNNSAKLYDYSDVLAVAGPSLGAPAAAFSDPVNTVTGKANEIAFSWSRLSNATQYDLKIAYDDAFTELVTGIDTGTKAMPTVVIPVGPDRTGTSQVNFMPGTTYYWKVRATAPLTSPYSEVRSFTIQPGEALVPTIGSPINGATISSTNPAFSWNPVSGTTMYEFQLAVSTNFAAAIFDTKLADTGIRPAVKLDPGMTYFWRVRAVAPVMGDWSTIANFAVAEEVTPTPPVVVQEVPPPVINIPAAPPAQQIVIPPAPTPPAPIAPAYIWAIIIIGAVLVIAVIVLIVRTRRSV